MNINDVLTRINKRKKSLNRKEHIINLLLLILPSLLVSGIATLAISLLVYSSFFSVFLIALLALVLPMFYAVEKRLFSSIYGVGKKDFNYIDGYTSFFTQRQLGLFGIFGTLLYGIMIAALLYLIFFRFFALFCTPFEGAEAALEKINAVLQSEASNETINVLESNLYLLVKPGIVVTSAIFYIPLVYMIFFSFNSNLSDHYLANVVLPDIDLNLPASQSRSLSKVSFKRYIRRNVFQLRLITNWPIYVAFTLLYVGLTFLFISFDYSSSLSLFAIPICIGLVPISGLFLGLILNYNCLINEYIIADELSPNLHEALPKAIRDSVRATFKNPAYIHGQQSVVKGDFFPEDSHIFDANNFTNASPNVTKEETYEAYSDNTEVQGGIFDFTKDKLVENKVEKKKEVKNPVKKEVKKTSSQTTNKATKTKQKVDKKKE